MNKQKPLLRAVSGVLLLSFACQELAMARGEISVPVNLGHTRVANVKDTDRTLIHIEDAHDSL